MVYCTDTATKLRQQDRIYLDGMPLRQYLGVSALAELMLVDASGVIPISGALTFEAAALLGCCLTTGAAAVLNTAALRPGQAVLIIGCGGVGLGAIQAARIGGATTIIAVDPEPDRRQAASSLGATSTIDPEEPDLLKAIRNASGTHGMDVAIEAVGDPALAALAFTALAPAGKAIIIGMMPPDSQIPIPASLLRHGRSLAGSVMGEVRSRHDIPIYQQLVASGQMHADELATSRWPLEDVNTAFSHAAARNGIRTMIEF
jgi:S-(hydroxymethyl)glutathione dehydrogenase / alcohol dehydrogenase